MTFESSPWENRLPAASVSGGPRQVTLVEGQTFCIAEASGDIHETAPLGLFYLDERILSRWQLRLNGHPLESLAVTTPEPFASMHVTRGEPAVGQADANVVVVRHRHISNGMRERLSVTNYGLEELPVLLALASH